MNIPKTADIVIVGGGVMGASAAYHLASHRPGNLVLLEREALFGQGSTGKCAGGVRYQFGTEINIKLSLESLGMLERFKEEIGQEINYRKCGYLFALNKEADAQAFRYNYNLQNSLGVNTQWLNGEDIRRMLPMMQFDDVIAGTFHQKDGLVDPNSVVMGYINNAKNMGAQTFNNVEVTGIIVRGDRVEGVETNQGVIETRTVLITTGAWTEQIGNMAGLNIPIQPIRRQMFTTTPLMGIPFDFPFVIDFSNALYFHREGNGLLIGMSNRDEKPAYNQMVDEEFELKTLEFAIRRMPLLEKAARVSHWAGLYEVTPDAHPILGRTNLEGFYICAGFSGHGFMHGPVSGKLMSELILDGKYSTLDASMLDLDRFEQGRMIKEYNVV